MRDDDTGPGKMISAPADRLAELAHAYADAWKAENATQAAYDEACVHGSWNTRYSTHDRMTVAVAECARAESALLAEARTR